MTNPKSCYPELNLTDKEQGRERETFVLASEGDIQLGIGRSHGMWSSKVVYKILSRKLIEEWNKSYEST